MAAIMCGNSDGDKPARSSKSDRLALMAPRAGTLEHVISFKGTKADPLDGCQREIRKAIYNPWSILQFLAHEQKLFLH
jgi:hypothetical protein